MNLSLTRPKWTALRESSLRGCVGVLEWVEDHARLKVESAIARASLIAALEYFDHISIAPVAEMVAVFTPKLEHATQQQNIRT